MFIVCIANILPNNASLVNRRERSFTDISVQHQKKQNMATQVDSHLNFLVIIQYISEAYSLAPEDDLSFFTPFSLFFVFFDSVYFSPNSFSSFCFSDPSDTNRKKRRIPLAGTELLRWNEQSESWMNLFLSFFFFCLLFYCSHQYVNGCDLYR